MGANWCFRRQIFSGSDSYLISKVYQGTLRKANVKNNKCLKHPMVSKQSLRGMATPRTFSANSSKGAKFCDFLLTFL